MKINVNICIYNTKVEWFKEAVDSVLNQTINDWTLIIVNDGTTDEKVLDYLEELENNEKIEIIDHDKNCGLPTGRNTFLENLDDDCEFISIFDADDKMVENKLEKQLKYMKENPDVDILGTQIYGKINTNHPEFINDKIFKSSVWFLNNPTLMVRRRVYDKVGKYTLNPKYINIEDYEFLTRCYLNNIVIRNLQEALTFYRVHGEQITMNRSNNTQELLRKLKSEAIKKKRNK